MSRTFPYIHNVSRVWTTVFTGEYLLYLLYKWKKHHYWRIFVFCVCWFFVLTSPVRDGADCPKAWLLIRTRLFTSPPPADIPPVAPSPPNPPEGPCQASWLTPACRLLDRGSSCLPVRSRRHRDKLTSNQTTWLISHPVLFTLDLNPLRTGLCCDS